MGVSPSPSPRLSRSPWRSIGITVGLVGGTAGLLWWARSGHPHEDGTATETDRTLQSKGLHELLAAYVTYRLCTITPLVQYGPSVLDLLHAIGLKPLAQALVSNTFFATFCGGGDADAIVVTGQRLLQQGQGTIVDYAEEEVHFDAQADVVQQTVPVVARFTDSIMAASRIGAGSFVALRMTTFCPHEVLKRLSSVILAHAEQLAPHETIFDREDLVQAQFSAHERRTIQHAGECLIHLVNLAAQQEVHIMLDAETWETQPAIDQIFLQVSRAMAQSERERMTTCASGRPTMFQTFQAYTRTCPQRMQQAIRFAEANEFPLGVKLVRGAYVEAEARRAVQHNQPSPLWSTKEETDRCYNDAIVDFAERMRTTLTGSTVEAGPVALMLATHNEQSVDLGLQERASLAREQRRRIFFAQLYGMGRELSHKAVQAAAIGAMASDSQDANEARAVTTQTVPDVYKYVPYGPLDVVMPYLARRATENLGMRSLAVHEYRAAGREIRRRLFAR